MLHCGINPRSPNAFDYAINTARRPRRILIKAKRRKAKNDLIGGRIGAF